MNAQTLLDDADRIAATDLYPARCRTVIADLAAALRKSTSDLDESREYALALEAELKARAEQTSAFVAMASSMHDDGEADNQRLRDRDRVLADFIADFAAAKIDALRYQPAYGESPEDAPDPVVDAETVWAWQADARAALAKPAEKAGARC